MARTPKSRSAPVSVFQFKITLQDIAPAVWRRIQVPSTYTFWDLHVAITDCMPWLDYHLHVFEAAHPKTGKPMMIGIPDDDGELEYAAGWEHKIARHFRKKGAVIQYEYDFGDSWHHEILFEGEFPAAPGMTYPKCLEGRRAGPPEDVGGVSGYENFLETILDLKNPEREEMLGWAESLTGNPDFDPEAFDPAKVRFDNPQKRWKVAFGGAALTRDMRCYESFKRLEGR